VQDYGGHELRRINAAAVSTINHHDFFLKNIPKVFMNFVDFVHVYIPKNIYFNAFVVFFCIALGFALYRIDRVLNVAQDRPTKIFWIVLYMIGVAVTLLLLSVMIVHYYVV